MMRIISSYILLVKTQIPGCNWKGGGKVEFGFVQDEVYIFIFTLFKIRNSVLSLCLNKFLKFKNLLKMEIFIIVEAVNFLNVFTVIFHY